MKVNELFEAYTPPVKNPKLGFREKVKSTKHGIPIGGTKEWLKSFGATETDINQALRVVRQSDVYRRLKAMNVEDASTDRHHKLGSIMLIAYIKTVSFSGKERIVRDKFTVQANGKIDETAPNDFHRAPVNGPKPRIVPGDAVSSIAKTMQASLEKVAQTVERRAKEGAKKLKAIAG